MSVETRSKQRCFEGTQGFYTHESHACAGPMRFSVFLPDGATVETPVPALYFLAGLTCTEETFVIKAGAQRVASELRLALVTCDTSPRATRFPGDDLHWDFGQGAGFYLDATEAPWRDAYRMETYVTHELRSTVESHFPIAKDRRGIFGHSMGGHGALTLALRHPGLYASVSALAPIVAPSEVPWGTKAFTGYLGTDMEQWKQHDACALLEHTRFPGELLVDVGTDDKFLERELRPQRLREVCDRVGQKLRLNMLPGHDHSYYFIATCVESHLRHHARTLSEA